MAVMDEEHTGSESEGSTGVEREGWPMGGHTFEPMMKLEATCYCKRRFTVVA